MNPPDLTGALPLPSQTLILVEGEDRLRFLNGQVTNDVGQADEQSSVYAAVLNAKGQHRTFAARCTYRDLENEKMSLLTTLSLYVSLYFATVKQTYFLRGVRPTEDQR